MYNLHCLLLSLAHRKKITFVIPNEINIDSVGIMRITNYSTDLIQTLLNLARSSREGSVIYSTESK